MTIKKALLVLVLMLALCPAWSEGIDLVVMVDISESMFRVFPDLVDYLLTDLLTKRLRFGDTFHLLTFADTPEVDTAAPVDSAQSIEGILKRLLLLKPLGGYTDLVAALRFLSSYVRELPELNKKTILLLTDGIHDPPPDSPFRMDPDDVRRQLFQTAQEIARAGWRVHILRLPQNGGTPSVLPLADGGALVSTPFPDSSAGTRGSTGPSGAPAGGASTGASGAAPASAQQEPGGAPAAGTPADGIPGGAGSPGATAGGAQPGVGATAGGAQPEAGVQAATSAQPAPRVPDYVDEISRVLRAPVTDYPGTPAELPGALEDLPAAVGFPSLEFPRGTLRGGRRMQVSFGLRSSSPEALYLELDGILLDDGTNILQEPASVIVPSGSRRELVATLMLPESLEPGSHRLDVELRFAGGVRVSPSRGTLAIEYSGRSGVVAGVAGRARSGGAAIVFVLLGLGGLVLILLVAFGLRSRIDLGSLGRGVKYREASYTRERARGQPLIEMVVTMQNRHIGHRNVHSLAPGGSRTVGGGRSSFLIYFVRVPAGIAYLTYDGKTYTFVPVRGELFPETSGPVADCIGREIPAVSPRGYRFTIVFRRFRAPLEELNDLLTSIRVTDSRDV